jgi:hypothetical protein
MGTVVSADSVRACALQLDELHGNCRYIHSYLGVRNNKVGVSAGRRGGAVEVTKSQVNKGRVKAGLR